MKKKGEELHEALQATHKVDSLEKRAQDSERRYTTLHEEHEKAQVANAHAVAAKKAAEAELSTIKQRYAQVQKEYEQVHKEYEQIKVDHAALKQARDEATQVTPYQGSK